VANQKIWDWNYIVKFKNDLRIGDWQHCTGKVWVTWKLDSPSHILLCRFIPAVYIDFVQSAGYTSLRLVKSKLAELLVDLHWHNQAGGGGIGLESCKPTFQHILPNDSAEKILQISCQPDPLLILLDLHKTPGQIHVVTRATGLLVHPEV
jgi:hypothetical protein